MPLHPVVAAMLEKMKGMPALSAGTPEEGRALVAAGRAALGEGPEMAQVRDIDVPTRTGSIRARLFVPQGEPTGLVVHLHGGGWVLGAIEDFDTYARALAAESGCAVLLPEYRLAPEHPFPAGLEDAEDVLLWAAKDGAGHGTDLPLVLSGDSAGANLATVAARKLGRGAAALQVLYYPVADCDFETESYARHGEGLPLTRRDMRWFFDHYAPPGRWLDPDISPLRAPDLSGLPPAVVVTAEYDVLAHEGAAYAERLRAAGVPVVERRCGGLTHGFVRLHNLLDPAREELQRVGRDIAMACCASRRVKA